MPRCCLLPFLVFALFPFYHMTLTSLKQDRELYDRNAVPLLIRQGPTLEHYTKLIWDTEFLTWTKNSLLVTILATAVSVVIGTLAAYALARHAVLRGGRASAPAIFVTYLVPTSLLFLPLAQVVNWLGLADSKWALVRDVPDLPGAVLHVAPHGLLPHRAQGGRGVRDGGRGHPHPGALAHRAAHRRARAGLRGRCSPSRCPGTSSSTR